jgi:hypothetical protein
VAQFNDTSKAFEDLLPKASRDGAVNDPSSRQRVPGGHLSKTCEERSLDAKNVETAGRGLADQNLADRQMAAEIQAGTCSISSDPSGSGIVKRRGPSRTGENSCRSIRHARRSNSNEQREDLVVTLNMAREWLRNFVGGEFVADALTKMRRAFPHATLGELNRAYLVMRDQFVMWVTDGGDERFEDFLTLLDLIVGGAPDREIAAAIGVLGCWPDAVFPRTPRSDIH